MSKKPITAFGKFLAFVGGFHIAIICMVFLFILTLLSTFEQQGPGGLYWTLDKYFSFDAYWVQPTWFTKDPETLKLVGTDLPIVLPGGYWVCALFTLNLIIGGVMRIRKGWKYIPIIVSHMSMVMLMVGGAVTYHQSREAYMEMYHGEIGDYASSLTELSIEVAEIKEGDRQQPYVINSELLAGVRGKPDREREFLFEDLPFNVTVRDYHIHANYYQAQTPLPKDAVVYDGNFILPAEPTGFEEKNLSSCVLEIKEKASGKVHQLLLFEGFRHDITVTIDDVIYGFRLHGELWPMPFKTRLDSSKGEKHPGTQMAMVYESEVTVLDGSETGKHFKIEMNQPLRYNDLTLYQTRWDDSEGKTLSGFTVKTNPSDKWPEYSIYVCGVALFVHFIIKLFGYVTTSLARSKNEH